MKSRELANLGIPKGQTMTIARQAVKEYAKDAKGKFSRDNLRKSIQSLVANPEDFIEDAHFGLSQPVLDANRMICIETGGDKTVRVSF